jgi:hypothetical protein
MKVHRQFDLDIRALKSLNRDGSGIPQKIEEFLISLSKKGYTVLNSSSYVMGIPQSITLIKEVTGSIGSAIAMTIKEDFDAVSEKAGVRKMFS